MANTLRIRASASFMELLGDLGLTEGGTGRACEIRKLGQSLASKKSFSSEEYRTIASLIEAVAFRCLGLDQEIPYEECVRRLQERFQVHETTTLKGHQPVEMVTEDGDWKPRYQRWSDGGWYVTNVQYPDGAVGCVSNNYPDRKWRIVSDTTGTAFPDRDSAARAERVVASAMIVEPLPGQKE